MALEFDPLKLSHFLFIIAFEVQMYKFKLCESYYPKH